GGGVARAIKDKGGPEIESEARKYAPIPIGHAIITSAGKLKCRFVIHAPTVHAPGGKSSAENVYKATKASLGKAREVGIKFIAYPLMGAGVGGLSPEESVRSMVKAFEELGGGLNVYLYVTNEEVFKRVIKELTILGWVPK
ncbi:MAG: macro domain-containing protein, partial [Zestosphaera sp.]